MRYHEPLLAAEATCLLQACRNTRPNAATPSAMRSGGTVTNLRRSVLAWPRWGGCCDRLEAGRSLLPVTKARGTA